MSTPAEQLARFAADLRFEAIPEPVVRFTENLLVDWFGSAVAGHGARPVMSIARFAQAMGPQPGHVSSGGASEVIAERGASTPYLAAIANAHARVPDTVTTGPGRAARRRGKNPVLASVAAIKSHRRPATASQRWSGPSKPTCRIEIISAKTGSPDEG